MVSKRREKWEGEALQLFEEFLQLVIVLEGGAPDAFPCWGPLT